MGVWIDYIEEINDFGASEDVDMQWRYTKGLKNGSEIASETE